MRIRIDTADPRSLYRQVADEIRALLARGELPPGTSLPSVRQLAADLGVNLNTVATAYRELHAAGLIEVRHGSGARVALRKAPTAGRDAAQKRLRAVLAEMVLAGMGRAEITRAIAGELRGLLDGAKDGAK